MKVFKLDKTTNKKTFEEYPRHDMGEIVGLNPNIVYFLTIDDPKPTYDPDTERLEYSEELTNEPHPDYPAIKLARGRWTVVELELPSLEEIKNNLKKELKEVSLEASSLVTAVKNIYYDPTTDTYNTPQSFKDLIVQLQSVRQRVLNDIEAFTDSKLAIKFKIRTEEAEQLLQQLKEYL